MIATSRPHRDVGVGLGDQCDLHGLGDGRGVPERNLLLALLVLPDHRQQRAAARERQAPHPLLAPQHADAGLGREVPNPECRPAAPDLATPQ